MPRSDGRSVLMLRATREARGRVESNIVWNYGHTTIPRHLRDVVVTEYGVADIRGASDEECIQRLLAISDSRFQDALADKARAAGKLARDWRIPEVWRRNTPEHLAQALAPLASTRAAAAFSLRHRPRCRRDAPARRAGMAQARHLDARAAACACSAAACWLAPRAARSRGCCNAWRCSGRTGSASASWRAWCRSRCAPPAWIERAVVRGPSRTILRMPRSPAMFALSLLLALHSAAPAADPAAATDPAAIAAAARDCSGCHVLDNPHGSPPIIDGQHADFLAVQLRAFRDSHRDAFPMGMLSEGLDEGADPRPCPRCWRRGPGPRSTTRCPPRRWTRAGRIVADAGCSACHGPSWRGGGIVPRVAGQAPSYLARQLRAMVEGRRAHPPMTLDASELNAVAAFLAAQR